ncbi:uncharacterized protein DUF4238 [Pseudomonas putida]|uniref:DUF4238 domain-containing protein n=1 Tax=Pseudomonas putida TaxID=303 RepID=UPI001053D886|nr:DUF4238 domain-containing protein [Pseudomonas putida]TCP74089.1 uncharacterized protein DUF4238 [Pseudomonas putida]
MNAPKRHHYLPESYQKGFWNKRDEKIFFIEIESGKQVALAPLNAAVKRYMYRFDNPVEGVSATAIENPLLSDLDGRYVSALSSLEERFSPDERQSLAVALAFLRFRVPLMFRSFEYQATQVFIDSIRTDLVKASEAARLGIDLSSVEAFDSSTHGMLEVPKDLVLMMFLRSSAEFAFDIVGLDWKVYVSDDNSFITSDKPFTAVEGLGEFSHGFIRGTYIIPLSSRCLLELGEVGGGLSFETVSVEQAEFFNGIIAHCADERIFGSSFAQLEAALKYSDRLI